MFLADCIYFAQITVINAFFVIIFPLHDLIADLQTAVGFSRVSVRLPLQRLIQCIDTADTSVHRRQHLHGKLTLRIRVTERATK